MGHRLKCQEWWRILSTWCRKPVHKFQSIVRNQAAIKRFDSLSLRSNALLFLLQPAKKQNSIHNMLKVQYKTIGHRVNKTFCRSSIYMTLITRREFFFIDNFNRFRCRCCRPYCVCQSCKRSLQHAGSYSFTLQDWRHYYRKAQWLSFVTVFIYSTWNKKAHTADFN